MSSSILKASARTTAIMIAFTIIGTAMLAYTFDITRETISKNEEAEKLALISQTLPHNIFDNNLVQDAITLPASDDLGNDKPSQAFRASLNGKTTAIVLEVVAPDGYSGKIKLLVAILSNGEISGVRVVAHNETPGLGDYIDIAKSAWIKIFDNTSLSKVRTQDWKVKKDGGQFDYMAGATITPRAVVKAVHKSLLYFEKNQTKLLAIATNNPERQP